MLTTFAFTEWWTSEARFIKHFWLQISFLQGYFGVSPTILKNAVLRRTWLKLSVSHGIASSSGSLPGCGGEANSFLHGGGICTLCPQLVFGWDMRNAQAFCCAVPLRLTSTIKEQITDTLPYEEYNIFPLSECTLWQSCDTLLSRSKHLQPTS